jgi:hypothetical protein
MTGSYRVDQPGHDPLWFATEPEADAEAARRTPTTNAPVVVWFDSWPYAVPPETAGEVGRRIVREGLAGRVGWLRMGAS